MAGINFNPQPMNNWKATAKSKEGNNQQAPQTGNINDFMNTKEGQAFLNTFKGNIPQPDANGYRDVPQYDIDAAGVKKNNDPSVKPNSAEPTAPQTGNGGLTTDQIDALKAKVLAQHKPDLPPTNTNTDKRPDDAPPLPPAYEKRTNNWNV